MSTRADPVPELTYFTHEVDGRLYGGWYRSVADLTVEIYARGQVRRARRGRFTPAKKAARMLEEIVRGLPGRAATSSD